MTALARVPSSSKAAAVAPPRKPLYLLARRRTMVDVEAENLLVRREQASAQRFPFARIDRIICNRMVDWSGDALCLCQARGLTVTWVSGRGQAVGQCVPRLGMSTDFRTLLEVFVELPDWAVRYQAWLKTRRLRVLATWAMRKAQAGTSVTADEWEQRKRDYVYRSEMPAVLDNDCHGACHAWIVAHLHRAGLLARVWGYAGHPLELAHDLSALLWAEMNLAAGTFLHGAASSPETLLFFENWTRLHGDRIVDHLAQLKRMLSQEHETWR